MSKNAVVSSGVAPSRRAVVRTAAWSVPVVAMAATAPAYAASPCAVQTITWSALGNGTTFNNTTTTGGIRVTLTVTGTTNAANNRTVSTTQTGGQTSNLRFYSGDQNGSSQTATFTFTRASNGASVDVRNLQFSFLDIDSGGNGWNDNIVVNTAGFASTIVSTTYVQGAGSAGSPFRANGNNTSGNVGGASTNGNVNVSWASDLSSVSFTYFQAVAATGSPFIGISNMSFQPVLC